METSLTFVIRDLSSYLWEPYRRGGGRPQHLYPILRRKGIMGGRCAGQRHSQVPKDSQ